METIKNKICVLAMIGIGVFLRLLTGDGTALVMMLIFGIPLFFAKDNWVG